MILRRATLHGSLSPVDIATDKGVIVAIAPPGQITPDAGDEVIDVDGRVVIPGLWDEHVHMGQWASHRRRIDVSAASSANEALQIMAAAQARHTGEVLVGAGMRPATWPHAPGLEAIDAVSGATPWVIFAIDIHSCWVNTAALDHFDVRAGGDGLLTEHDSFALLGRVENVDPVTHDQWVAEAEQDAARRGVVGIVDLDMGPTIDNWIRRRKTSEEFVIRVEASVYPDTLQDAIDRGLTSGADLAPGVVMGPLKAITDGSLNTRTAYVSTPYVGQEHTECGTLNYSLDEIHRFVSQAHAQGIGVTLHAIGDAANTIMLDVFEHHRIPGRIEHAQLVTAQDIHRFASLGVTASVQPQHAVDDREVTDRLWSDRVEWAFPVKRLVEAGAHVVFGSDAPVSELDPWVQISAAVTRTDDDRDPWQPGQAISVAQAIACSTRNSVSVGEPADLVVLDADPFFLEGALAGKPVELARALRTLPVALTVVAGRVTHRATDERE